MKFFSVVIVIIANLVPSTLVACDCGCADGAIGIFWGDFELPNKEHLQIMQKSLESYEIKKIVLVINNFHRQNQQSLKTSALERENIFKQIIPAAIRQDVIILTQTETNLWDYQAIKQRFSNYKRHYVVVGTDAYLKFIQQYGKSNIEKNYDVILLFPQKQLIPKQMLAKNVLFP
jgi:nicotinic acid mononucleotide adenylyltransferase